MDSQEFDDIIEEQECNCENCYFNSDEVRVKAIGDLIRIGYGLKKGVRDYIEVLKATIEQTSPDIFESREQLRAFDALPGRLKDEFDFLFDMCLDNFSKLKSLREKQSES